MSTRRPSERATVMTNGGMFYAQGAEDPGKHSLSPDSTQLSPLFHDTVLDFVAQDPHRVCKDA